ncbi:zinc-binding alcohol dehydrogenase family protein KNAG_0I02260 [Huiozyma naganishii CBS 8797]|uniref:Enoyl reductase (ER) domain-containing protein n=1 Tax=Huiozyma naganishii (strain ATCC MYA-139 / BCRC 22969 / CBS 8797 / KCTC 17520 / NBRC 10181 / NCYC 3082 / Yp74L-3) TaxID=1071383 RepID=J7S2H1_HUIN7|nr:hypothetical protein KNAG_0I02260 [Kazachstania naganishii CBS 8797]CCK72012.1 hypothetical protein KNAG_0I02260 [Kazachstania naganishii CBS 8797]
MSLPSTMDAVVIDGDRAVVRSGVPVPTVPKGYLLVRTRAVAANPTDWKHIAWKVGPQGSILGVDVAGEVVQLGDGVDTAQFSKGDCVYGFVHGACVRAPENGAFGQYAAVDSQLVFKMRSPGSTGPGVVPRGRVNTWEAAASIPCSIMTAGETLFHHMKLEMDWQVNGPAQIPGTVLVWGAGTTLGQWVIQLLKRFHAFSRIVVVASRRHEAQLRQYGADELFDYHDGDVVNQIKSKHGDLIWLLDCVSTRETFRQTYQCAPANKPSTVFNYDMLTVDVIPETERNEKYVTVDGTLLYLITGNPLQMGDHVFPADEQYRQTAIKFIRYIGPYLRDGSLVHVPLKVVKGGLNAVPDMLDDVRNGRTAGHKLVTLLE